MSKTSLIKNFRHAVSASVLIGLGNCALLKVGQPLGPFLFALGLLAVCILGQDLFTGKCGFVVADKIPPKKLVLMLATNLLSGYLFGIFLSYMDPSLQSVAMNKVEGFVVSFEFFAKSVLCGMVMYLAVAIYRKQSVLGILIGVPLFIFCGFQHCIANVITLGVARVLTMPTVFAIGLSALGNFIGAFLLWSLTTDELPKGKDKGTAATVNRITKRSV